MQKREELQQHRLEELKRKIAIGIAQADQGQLPPSGEVFRKLREQQVRFENALSK
jgi:hypothetical protein